MNVALTESVLIHHHGQPVAIGLDSEFNNKELLSMLTRNGITPAPRPSPRHNKLGPVERKHRAIWVVLAKLAVHYPEEAHIAGAVCYVFVQYSFRQPVG